MTRREMMLGLAATAALRGQKSPLHNLGGSRAGFPMAVRAAGGRDKLDFVDYFHKLGLGVAEIGAVKPGEEKVLRQKLDDWGMRALADFPLPKDAAGVADYETLVKTAKDAGVSGCRAALTARRY